MTTTPALNDDLVRRIKATARDLRKNVSLASFGGEETGVRVKSPDLLLADLDEAASALEAQSKEIEALRSALEPSAETKAAYSGEFYERVEISNPNFDEDDENEPETLVQQVPVSWTTIKEIMAAIRARTALKGA